MVTLVPCGQLENKLLRRLFQKGLNDFADKLDNRGFFIISMSGTQKMVKNRHPIIRNETRTEEEE